VNSSGACVYLKNVFGVVMNSRHRKMVRRANCCALVVLYLLVATAANLFHTEIYNTYPSVTDPQSQTDTKDTGVNISTVSSNQLRLALMGDYCPVCAFFKTHHSQTYQTADLVSINTRPAFDFGMSDVYIPHKHPLPAIPTRGPPAVLS